MSDPAAARSTSSVVRRVRPGSWFGIFGDHATVLLPPSEKARVAALWDLVDDGAGFDEVLDALISDGLRTLPGFVLVSDADADASGAPADTKVVVRGAARARFVAGGEEVELVGSAATTWVERTLEGVTHMLVEVDDQADAADDGAGELAVADGLVRVGRVETGTAPAPPGASPEPPADTASTPAGDADGPTRTDAVPQPSYAGVQAQESAPAETGPVARLVLSHGETVAVDRPVLVGRAPDTHRYPDEPQPLTVTVPSPQQEISSTHVELRPGTGADHGSAVVTDLGSTNGTVLVQPGLAPEDLRAGVPVPLLPGAIIDLGDGLTIQVLGPDAP